MNCSPTLATSVTATDSIDSIINYRRAKKAAGRWQGIATVVHISEGRVININR